MSALTLWCYVILTPHRVLSIIDSTPVYVINLDRSKDRLSEISNTFSKENLKFYRFSASDGYSLIFLNLNKQISMSADMLERSRRNNIVGSYKVIDFRYENAMFMFTDFLKSRKLSLGEIGCSYSHRAIWIDMLNHRYDVAVVFEDDIVPLGNFKQNLNEIITDIPEEADLIMLDYKYYEKLTDAGHRGRIFPVVGHNCLGLARRDTSLYGTYAYVITRRGAEKLLKLTQRLDNPIDCVINELVKRGEVNRFVTRYRVVRTIAGTSIIRKMGRC